MSQSTFRVGKLGLTLTNRSYHNLNYTFPRYFEMMTKNSEIFDQNYFEDRQSRAIDATVRTVKPIVKFNNNEIQLRYNVGTRGNRKDAPRWPQDLMTEVVE